MLEVTQEMMQYHTWDRNKCSCWSEMDVSKKQEIKVSCFLLFGEEDGWKNELVQVVWATFVLMLKCCRIKKPTFSTGMNNLMYGCNNNVVPCCKCCCYMDWASPRFPLIASLALSLALLRSCRFIPDIQHARYLWGIGDTSTSCLAPLNSSHIPLRR